MKLPTAFELPNMKVRNPRVIFAGSLLALSLLAAIAITSQANRSVVVWSAKGELAVGDVITQSDLAPTKVLLPENSLKYLSGSAKLVGSVVTRRIGSGELIPSAALSREAHALEARSVPFKVGRNDLPSDLLAGQNIDLYVLPAKDVSTLKPLATRMVAHNVVVENIDLKARDIGGDIGIVLKIPDSAVLEILTAVAAGRAVVVRNAI
jgi:hypothetical protein